ncbi:hypothetical protein C6501_00070 [Candidatus Poribacteria bacterium]|nr:MAG: hypothetical protein C6501_00070 [Candidatus Poribacteria bacterium]
MRYLFILCLSFSICFLGCGEDPDEKARWNVLSQDVPPAEVATKSSAEKILKQLKQEFGDDVLDVEFKTINALVNSTTYLQFISPDVEYENFSDFVVANSPPKDWYKELVEDWIDKPHDADYLLTHYLSVSFRHGSALEYHGHPKGAAEDYIADTIAEPHVWAWLNERFTKSRRMVLFTVDVGLYSDELEEKDIALCYQLFEEYGEEDGIIMLALNYPLRLAQVLNDFSNSDIFLKWANGDFVK